jgi:hypothetical protein
LPGCWTSRTRPRTPGTRRYRLPDVHAEVLLDADNPAHAGAAAYWIGSLAEVLQRVPGIYRSGEGLPYPEYGADCRLAIANFNRPMYVNDLAGWFATVPEVQARLEAEGTRVLDVGCGIGWSSISLARAFPSLRVDGIDADEASIAEAERLAADAGMGDRVRFRVADAAELGAAGEGGYDAAFVPRRRGRAAQLRVQLVALPTGQPGRDPVGGRRHGPALGHRALVIRPGRLRQPADPARGPRLLAVLPAGRLTPQLAGTSLSSRG